MACPEHSKNQAVKSAACRPLAPLPVVSLIGPFLFLIAFRSRLRAERGRMRPLYPLDLILTSSEIVSSVILS
jgi:hypothetical protein